MKFNNIILISLITHFSATSCLVLVEKDSGKHKGWYKNTNNPHHPKTTKPEKGKSSGHGKEHHKK